MNEERSKNRATLWIVLAAILGLLIGCGAGSLTGGLLGYAAGRSTARAVLPSQSPPPVYRSLPEDLPSPPVPPDPIPELPDMPFGPNEAAGALIIAVVPDSPADLAGLRMGDIIVAVNGVSLDEGEELADRVLTHEPGETIELMVRRGADQILVQVALERHPDRAGDIPWIGVEYRTISGHPMGRPHRQSD
jgi:membrane-associated protease RseP (regulator of RpoE activity)